MSIRANTDRAALNERITFERSSATQDENTGRRTSGWAPVKEVWAKVDGQKARDHEPVQAGAAQSVSEYTVWVRADIIDRYAITDVDRIRWKGKVFDIRDIPDQQLRGRLIAIICTVNRSSSP